MRKLFVLPLCALLAGAAWAQSVIYRCGNEYTNHAAQARAKGCKPVEGGGVTIIHGTRPARPAAATARPAPAPAEASAASPAGAAAPAAARIDSNTQRARDADARTILQSELGKSQARLAELKAEYGDGNPPRTALEMRNPQGYLQRVEKLKADIARQESDIAGIRRELQRLPPS